MSERATGWRPGRRDEPSLPSTKGPGPHKKLEELFSFSVGVQFPNRHRLRKHHADEYTGGGEPDYYGHIFGKAVGIELKVSHDYFSEKQKVAIREYVETGAQGFGLVEVRGRGGSPSDYFILPALAVFSFSYKERSLWIPLSVVEASTPEGKRPMLNLQPLRAMLS